MSDPYVRTTDTVTDLDGCEVRVGVDYDAVTVTGPPLIRFDRVQAEEFGRAYLSACWMAGQQAEHLRETGGAA